MAMLEIKDIHKTFYTYDDKPRFHIGPFPRGNARRVRSALHVLNGVDLSVEKGDVVAILGPSGSGKTTLLRCLNFLETADSGTLVFDGESFDLGRISRADIARLRKKTAFVFQNYNLFRNKTALQNVTEGLIVARRMPKEQADEIGRRMLEKVGLADRADYYPRQLSGGQQQRVAIARALATENGKTMAEKAHKLGVELVEYITKDEALQPSVFTDVKEGAYYVDAVNWAVDKKVTSGKTETTFAPNDSCTRAQAVTFLWRAAGSPEPTASEMTFTDVKADSYYDKAVLWAVENKITSGMSDTLFAPDATCSRSQIVTFLYRMQNSPKSKAENPFTDVKADAYYANAVLWAVESGVTTGASATTFDPAGDCTRGQIVTFLYRCLSK